MLPSGCDVPGIDFQVLKAGNEPGHRIEELAFKCSLKSYPFWTMASDFSSSRPGNELSGLSNNAGSIRLDMD